MIRTCCKWIKLKNYFVTYILSLIILFTASCQTDQSAISPSVKSGGRGAHPINAVTQTGEVLDLYHQSHALLIGISNYTAGWPNLESIPGELDMVETTLQSQGFNVIKKLDLDAVQLKSAFEKFINNYGYGPKNRLLFFFSGHGHSRANNTKGYLVPADAPKPDDDKQGFLSKALHMNQILAWSRQIEAKHALFLFDSCFSGTVFKTKSLSEPPHYIRRATAEPIRYFITAGSAGETVPAKSTFAPMFVNALRYGFGDTDQDGYVTGTELGSYIEKKLPDSIPNQTPQSGSILDYELSQGNFVFALAPKQPPPNITLTVETVPDDAQIKIQNINEPYQSGMRLPVGEYLIEVSKPPCYETYRKQHKWSSAGGQILDIELNKANSEDCPLPPSTILTVLTSPSDAQIRIPSIDEPYQNNMRLPVGSYLIEVSKPPCYETHQQRHTLSAGRQTVSIELYRSSVIGCDDNDGFILESFSFSNIWWKKLTENEKGIIEKILKNYVDQPIFYEDLFKVGRDFYYDYEGTVLKFDVVRGKDFRTIILKIEVFQRQESSVRGIWNPGFHLAMPQGAFKSLFERQAETWTVALPKRSNL